ncbi:MAG TPA: helix-turn-helix transcriptional regulator [Candidatus Saccharimonadales bacterium]|nr:helix-turn-helix transcriptional regulator [Candidatus Saccharimonadales bacterium]
MKLHNNLGRLMTEKGITEEELARRTGIRQNSINPIKNGKQTPKIDTALRIAKAMKVRLDRIWSLSDRHVA